MRLGIHETISSDAGTGTYFVDHLTLFEPGRADFPHLLLLDPQCFSPSGITGYGEKLNYAGLFHTSTPRHHF